ncbi:MAG: phosphohydrolase [Patescibacteria group bacterium]|nr:phosphohydrolase [Patescibacteria group bacterium]MDD4610421.1 phosphohydrolase [Patescibacteria group bacterium]
MQLSLNNVKNNSQIKNFIKQTDHYLDSINYTDHGFRHANLVSDRAKSVARQIKLSAREQELAGIAGYCHDMGNFLGRTQHNYLSANLFFQLFIGEENNPEEVTRVMQAIATHDKDELNIVHKISAILVLADKSDVHRTRVRKTSIKNIELDIHDRVNYAVVKNDLLVNTSKKEIILKLNVDRKITSIMEYFEIFNDRMAFCRKAAKYLGFNFVLIINNFKL